MVKKSDYLRKMISLMLVLVMLLGMMPVTAFATEEKETPELARANAEVWEIGTIAYGNGLNRGDKNRLRTAEYLELEDYSAVTIGFGYKLVWFVYDADYNMLGRTGWLNEGEGFSVDALKTEYPAGTYFRVALCATDGRDLTLENLADSGVKFYLPGEEAPLPKPEVEYENVANIGSWQDGAIWDGKLFALGASGTGAVFNVRTGEKLGNLALDGKDVIKPHANSVCFGSTYYAAGDKFPLLYVNVYNNYSSAADRMEGTCCIYRITQTDSGFVTELVQVIRIGFTEDLSLWKSKENNGDVRPYGNFVVDTDEGKLYAFVMRDANKTTRFFGFDIPSLDDGIYSEQYGCNVVTLEQTDIQTQFDTSYFNYLQGCCYSSGMILSCEGFGGDAPLRVVDLKTKSIQKTVCLGSAGLTSEPEVLCVDPADGTVYYAAADGMLRILKLDGMHFHSYKNQIIAPTCTEQGYTTYTCACGDSYVGDYVNATGEHTYDGGICTGCGMADPEQAVLPDTWPTIDTDLIHVICYGQSFSVGADAPYYADPAVDGVYVYGNITNSSNGTELTALPGSGGNQHPIISAGNVLAQLLASAGINTDIVLGSYGSGGRTIAQLMSPERQAQIKAEEGYPYDINSSGRYEIFQSSVAAIAQYANANGKTVSCPAIVYLQGETDQNTDQQLGYPDNPVRAGYGAGGDKEKYKEYMTRLKEDMQREVMEAYGQTEKPLFLIYQVSGSYVRTEGSTINMAQIEFAQENDDVILIQTPYFTSQYTGTQHLTVNGYRWLGEYIARDLYDALVKREKSWPMLPERIEVTGKNTVRITVSGAQNGLTIDTWTVENASNSKNLYGFYLKADGKNIVPTKVTVQENSIELTLPVNLTTDTVQVYYAGRHASGTGNIRDNCTERGFYEYLDDSNDTGTGNNQGVSHSALDANGNSIIGQKYPMYNWLASFCYEVEVPDPEKWQPVNYHWEMQGNELVSVTNGNAAKNTLTMLAGSVTDGILNKAMYSMETTIVLQHDLPWVIEWKAAGNGSSYYGGMFLRVSEHHESGAQYLYLPGDSRGMVAWGVSSDSANYGFQLGKLGIDTRAEHTYRIENRIDADGVNTIYLIVDGVEIGAMTTGYRTSSNTSGAAGSMIEEPKNWANGKDIYVNGIGASGSFLMNNMKLSYLTVWEAGQHTHSYTSTVTAPTCTEKGYTTYTCACGDSYADDYVDVIGHSFQNGICVDCNRSAMELDYTHAIPQSQGVVNAIARAYQLTDVEWTPVADMPGVDSIDGEYIVITYKAGETYKGVPYSGVIATDTYLGLNVTLESFLTALDNPNSVLYTENLHSTNPKSATYFGTVCSKFAQYVLDIPGSYNTNNVANIPGVDTIAMPGKYTVDQIKLGDIILHTQYHTAVCTDILYDADGNVAFVEISEAVFPQVRRKLWSPEEFYSHFSGYRLCRYQYINDVPAVPDALPSDREYALMPRFGDKYNYKVSSTKGVVDVLESGYSKAVILRDGEVISEIALNGASTFSFDRSVPGYLEMYLEKEDGTRSNSVYACVVKSSVSVTDVSAFLSGKLSISFDGSSGTPLYVQVGSGQSVFCSVEDNQTGEAVISFRPSQASSNTAQVRVAYQNEYGIYLSSWVRFTVDYGNGTGPNPSTDTILSQGVYWDGYAVTPSNHLPTIQDGKETYWTYTMVPVEENTTYYSWGANRTWYLDANGDPISTINVYKECSPSCQFTIPEGVAYINVSYSPSLVDQGKETMTVVTSVPGDEEEKEEEKEETYTNPSTDPLLSQGQYWPNHRMRPSSYTPEVDNVDGYWLYTMVPVENSTCYYSNGANRLWFFDANKQPISTYNAYKESTVPCTFVTPKNCAFVSIQYSPVLIEKGTETLTKSHAYTPAVTAPTCTEKGYTTYTCATCGDSYVADFVDATGEHTYDGGICTGCGKVEPCVPMSMRYDDHMDVAGKAVEIIDAGKPTSYQVGYGVAENTVADIAVVTLEGSNLVAAGCGKAKVRLDGQLYEITVEAAPISLLLLIGQSNMQGSEGDADQSIICPNGMVYSTYGDRYTMTVNNATDFAPSALTGNGSALNVNGTTTNLENWPVYLLNEAGAGKAGPDSGFAYEWVKQTGEKVWVVNAAHGGSAISTWQDGGANYEECVLLFQACQETLRKEIAAGHYTLSHTGYFWCQGCSDSQETAEWYVRKYLTLHNSLKTELAFDENTTFEFGGIIPILYGVNSYRKGVCTDVNQWPYYESFEQLFFNGPRVAQYWMINNPDLPDIWGVCNIGEDWVWMPDGTNGVTEYFQAHYPGGTVDYTTQVKQSASWYTPTTPKAVHDSIHYNQIGYNEVGREAARNALILLGETEKPTVETVVELLTWDGYTEVTQVPASTIGNSASLVVPVVYPLWKSKNVTYELSEGLRWDYYDLLVQDYRASGTLTVTGVDGNSVSVINHELSSYRWDLEDGVLVSTGNRENIATLLQGSIIDGLFVDTRYQLADPIRLLHDMNWILEWKMTGPWYDAATTSQKLFCQDGGSATPGSMCLLIKGNEHRITLGYYGTNTHISYGCKLDALGIDMADTHTYRLVNHINDDGSNTIFLFVDGKQIGPMTRYFTGSGGDMGTESNALSGVDFAFQYLGTPKYSLNNGVIEYISVVETGASSDIHFHDWSDWEVVTEPGPDGSGVNKRVCTCGETETREILSIWQTTNLAQYIQSLPENTCCGLNLWAVLNHDSTYYVNSKGDWDYHSSRDVPSITIPVNSGDRIFATSFGAADVNGHGSANGIRVTWFDVNGVLKTTDPAGTYSEFSNNGGYLIAPEGAIAVNIPLWGDSEDHEVYICNRDHTYDGGICTGCGDNPYAGKTLVCIGDSITYGVSANGNPYHKILGEDLGMNVTNLGASGWVMCTGGHRNCRINVLTEENCKGKDVVTIFLGINDWANAVKDGYFGGKLTYEPGKSYYALGELGSDDTSTIYGAMKMWCEKIVELRQLEGCKNTEFYFITPVITSWNNSVTGAKNWDQSKTNIHGYTLRDLCNAIIEVCGQYDVPVIDLNLISGMYYNSPEDNNVAVFGGDGVHPGEVGHQMMAEAIKDALLQNHQRDDHTHSYGSWITTTYPECEAGEQQRVCSICTAVEKRTVEGTGHTYQATVTPPTCTEQGYTTYTCVCGESFMDTYTEPLGHTSGEPVKENETKTGYDAVVYCEICGTELSREQVVLYIPGDINGDGAVNNKDATRLFQYMTGWRVEVVEAALDVNGDGKVNNKDATRLFQYLSGWTVDIY